MLKDYEFVMLVERRTIELHPDLWGFEEGYREIPDLPRALLAMSFVEGQVFNGGFHQLYWNGYGNVVEDAWRGYTALGLDTLANLVAESIELASADMESAEEEPIEAPPMTSDFREAYEFSRKRSGLPSLDQRWYDETDRVNTESIKRAWIERHPEQFGRYLPTSET